MHVKRIVAALVATGSLALAVFLYTAHPARGSDHQDTYNLANRSNTSADITDVFVFPSPVNPANVVLVMNVSPLIPAGMGTSKFFDPSLMWQFKIAHGATSPEDEVIQLGVSGTDQNQVVTVYGPAKPNEVGTVNTFVPSSGSVKYNSSATLSNGIQVFAGPRADPFYFDLFQFFSFLGDRAASNHTSQSDVGTGNTLTGTPTFNGYPAGSMSGTGASAYACSTKASTNALTDINGGFNVLSFVIEVPRTLLTNGYSSQVIHVWGTANSSTGA
jgi:hypothetical protein